LYIKAHLIQHIMAKSLRQKRRNGKNKTQRRRSSRKLNGGREFDEQNLHELKDLLGNNNNNNNNNPGHLFALHSDEETCGHCRQFKPEWEKVLARLTPHPGLTVAKLGPDATDYMNEHHYRKHNHMVNGVPTIIYYIVNKRPQEYDGERTADKIIAWLTNVLADNNLEINIKSKSQEDDAPFEAPVSQMEPVSEQASATVEPELAQTELAQTDLGPAATEPPAQQVQDAFPQAPLTPASTLSNATETIKTAAANVDSKIEQGVNSVKSALTSEFDVGEKIGNLFSSAPAPATDNNVVAAANPIATTSESPDLVPNPVNVPAVPSLVGGVKHRRTMRMHKKSKKSKNTSKKSKKSKKSKN
jgi:hypothetical protein